MLSFSPPLVLLWVAFMNAYNIANLISKLWIEDCSCLVDVNLELDDYTRSLVEVNQCAAVHKQIRKSEVDC